ncbi:MAG: hypothetical protein ABFD52_00680 [Acidobacteriota bacterium]
MPDVEGKITDEEKGTIKKWFEDKWKEPVICPVCREGTWIIADHVVTTLRSGQNTAFVGGITYPQVMLICKKCGLTLYFNAVMMGVVKPKEEANGKK